jgi:hypothetical protein
LEIINQLKPNKMTAEVSLEFLKKPVNEKSNYGDDRVGDMTGKPQFADMADHDIVLADGTTVNNELRAAIIAANGGNDAQKDALIPVEKKWDRFWKKVARYVTEKAAEKDTVDDQIAIINVSGFAYTKVVRTEGEAPGQTENFQAVPVGNVSGRAIIRSESLGKGVTYTTIFHTDPNWLDQVTYKDNQLLFPPTDKPFVLHQTPDPRKTEIELTSGEKWYGLRFGINGKGKGPNSSKVSVIPQ